MIGFREHDVADEALNVPVAVHKPNGDVIEELWVVRTHPGHTKVVTARDKPTPEEVVPNAVHENARCQGVVL